MEPQDDEVTNENAVSRKKTHITPLAENGIPETAFPENRTLYSAAATRLTASRSWSSDLSRLNRT